MRPTPAYAFAPPMVPRWKIVTPPDADALPVALNTVKTFINRPLEDAFWDTETTSFIRIAAAAIEAHCKITLLETTFQADIPAFYPNLRLDKRPFKEVVSLKYVSADDGQILDVDPTIWHANEIAQQCGMVFLGEDCDWPEAAKRTDAVRVQVKAGFAAGELPEEIEHALLMTVAALDANRGDEQQNQARMTVYAMKNQKGTSIVPNNARSLLSPYILRFI